MSFGWSLNDVVTQGNKRSKMSHHVPTITSWDINDSLAADFDGSLSGLGSELGTTSYNMSFQYILGAATSPAVKLNEETLTYLNQGQSYEIKLKKLGDLSDLQGKYLRSIVKICFHERRLQYMEREQIDSWRNTRPGERILDIDVPLSYGLVDVNIDRERLNGAEFIWDPTKETGVYIRVNCISTEFTAKKHGGEKGVPFRLQVESYTYEGTENKLIHCGSCQIKVFKPKGADRKHKTDREKMEKRTEAEKEKYQPSYECTVLTEVPLEQVTNIATPNVKSPNNSFANLTQSFSDMHAGSPIQKKPPGDDDDDNSSCNGGSGSSKKLKSSSSSDDLSTTVNLKGKPLTCDACSVEVTAWLHANRFGSYKQIFQNFSGADLLRLTREDLIQICGLADGIRLNNALQSKAIRPRLIIYVCQESDSVYHALYLEHLTSQELLEKLARLYNVSGDQIGELYCQGPSGIYVLLNDEVLQNMSEQSRFCVEAMKSETSDQYKVLLKSIS